MEIIIGIGVAVFIPHYLTIPNVYRETLFFYAHWDKVIFAENNDILY